MSNSNTYNQLLKFKIQMKGLDALGTHQVEELVRTDPELQMMDGLWDQKANSDKVSNIWSVVETMVSEYKSLFISK